MAIEANREPKPEVLAGTAPALGSFPQPKAPKIQVGMPRFADTKDLSLPAPAPMPKFSDTKK